MNESPEDRAAAEHEAVLRELGDAYAVALLKGDEVAAEQVIRAAMDARLTTGEVDDGIIAPALWLVGRLWERGEISIADEHLATEISLRVLALQREARRTSRARSTRSVLLAAPQGEMHVVALQMSANLLREAGFETLVLGADVPPHALVAAARRHCPHVVCLSATMPNTGERLLGAVHDLQAARPSAGYVVGGAGVSPRLRPLPGIEICRRVTEVVDAADAAFKHASMN